MATPRAKLAFGDLVIYNGLHCVVVNFVSHKWVLRLPNGDLVSAFRGYFKKVGNVKK